MTVQEYRDYIAAGNPVVAGSEAHLFMHKMSQEAIRITMEINNKTPTLVNVYSSIAVASFRIRVASSSAMIAC